MRRFLVLPAAAVILLAAQSAPAWNGTGHQVIALIAWNNLTPEARSRISTMLRAHPDFSTLLTRSSTAPDQRDRQAFVIAATWPDLVRTPNTPSSRYNRPVWHYVDFPYVLGNAAVPPDPDVAWRPNAEPANAAQAFKKNLADLQNEVLSDRDRAVALCWIEHLTGDIHQPLHAVSLYTPELPKGDQGGNQLMVTANSSVINLHALWDGMVGNYQEPDAIAHLAEKLAQAHPRSEFAEALKDTSFDNWAHASFENAKEVVYNQGQLRYLRREELAKDKTQAVPEAPAEYLTKGKAAAESYIALAGYRLADTLNRTLAQPPATMPGAAPPAAQ